MSAGRPRRRTSSLEAPRDRGAIRVAAHRGRGAAERRAGRTGSSSPMQGAESSTGPAASPWPEGPQSFLEGSRFGPPRRQLRRRPTGGPGSGPGEPGPSCQEGPAEEGGGTTPPDHRRVAQAIWVRDRDSLAASEPLEPAAPGRARKRRYLRLRRPCGRAARPPTLLLQRGEAGPTQTTSAGRGTSVPAPHGRPDSARSGPASGALPSWCRYFRTC